MTNVAILHECHQLLIAVETRSNEMEFSQAKMVSRDSVLSRNYLNLNMILIKYINWVDL